MGKFRIVKIALIIAGLLLAAAVIFISIKLFKGTDARELYFKAESKSFEKYSLWLNENYSSFMEKQLPYTNTANKRRTEVTADIKSGGKSLGLEGADNIIDLINRSKLVLDIKRQPQEGTAIADVALLVEKVPFINAQLFQKAGTLYGTVPILLPGKYFSAKLEDIDEVYEKLSIPIRPKTLINGVEIAKILKFNKTDFDVSAKNIGSVFTKLITEDAVKYRQDKEITISGQMVKGREVLVTLDGPSATSLLNELASAIASDEALLSYTYGNLADLSTLLDDAGLFRLFDYLNQTGAVGLNDNKKDIISNLSVKKDFDGFKKFFKETVSSYTLKDGLKMAVVIDKYGNILERKLTLEVTAQQSDKTFKLDINTGSSSMDYDNCRNRFTKIVMTEPGIDGSSSKLTELQIMPVFSKLEGTDLQGNIDVKYSVTEPGGSKSGADVVLDISGKTDKLTLKKNDIIKYNVKIYGEGGDGNLEGELNSLTWSNKKLNTVNRTTNISINANFPALGIQGLSVAVNLAGEDKLGIEPFTMPDVQQSNITDLNAATGQDLDRVGMEIMASFGSFYLANKPIVDAIIGQ